jgi:uncharacterized membrane protein YbhN (UPF0104 family)
VFAFARLATAIPITPGGAGLVEVILIGGLVAAGGANAHADRLLRLELPAVEGPP